MDQQSTNMFAIVFFFFSVCSRSLVREQKKRRRGGGGGGTKTQEDWIFVSWPNQVKSSGASRNVKLGLGDASHVTGSMFALIIPPLCATPSHPATVFCRFLAASASETLPIEILFYKKPLCVTIRSTLIIICDCLPDIYLFMSLISWWC